MVNSVILLLAAFYATCVLLPTVTGDGNFIICESESDPVIYRNTHDQVYHGMYTKEYVKLNLKGMTITCIKAIDNWNDGTGGTATLKSGGLGQSTAKLLLKGQLFRGYSFDVTVRGKPAQH